jgi:hypothetical protein
MYQTVSFFKIMLNLLIVILQCGCTIVKLCNETLKYITFTILTTSVFLNLFFQSRHHSLLKEYFDGILGCNLLEKGHKVHDVNNTPEVFQGTKVCRSSPVEKH